MHLQKKRILFYGDDTWLKLFPNHFTKSEGTTSFFVSDTTEVDNNVTRHLVPEMNALKNELEEDDWDVMILHYLGLDHVGHGGGPRRLVLVAFFASIDLSFSLVLLSRFIC